MNKHITTRGLVEGALMAALAFVLILGSTLPLLGIFFTLVLSLPITIATVRHGSFTGGLSAFLAALLTGLFLGPLSALSVGLQYMLLGWIFGYMLYHRKSSSKTLQAGVLTAAVSALLLFCISLGLMGFSPDNISATLDQYQSEMFDMYQSSGMLDLMTQQGMSAAQVKDMLQQTLHWMVQILPAMFILTRIVTAVLAYLITLQVLKRLRIRIPRIQTIQKWGLPFSFVWVLILVWALWLAGDYIQNPFLNILTLNSLILCGALLFFDGVSLSCFWFKFNQLSTPMKVFGIIFVVLFFSGFLVACILLGLADLLFDFRKLRVDNKMVRKG